MSNGVYDAWRETEVGHKDTAGKPRVDLIPYEAMKSIGRVREFGNNKYGDPAKWHSVTDPIDFIGATSRHLYKWLDAHYYGVGSKQDEESNLDHLDHAITSLAMAISILRSR